MAVLRRAALALVACTALACASGGGGGAGGTKINANIITSDEIAQVNEATAYDLVQRLRPSFLQTRMSGTGSPAASKSRGGSSASSGVQVFVGDTKEGGVDYLKSISSSQVKEIRYYTPSDAVSKWGTGNSAGAIQVTLR